MNYKYKQFFIMYRTIRQKYYLIGEWMFEYLFKIFPNVQYFDGMKLYCWVEKFVKY